MKERRSCDIINTMVKVEISISDDPEISGTFFTLKGEARRCTRIGPPNSGELMIQEYKTEIYAATRGCRRDWNATTTCYFCLVRCGCNTQCLLAGLTYLKSPWNENWFLGVFLIRYVLLLSLPQWQHTAQQWQKVVLQFWFILFYSEAFPGKQFKSIDDSSCTPGCKLILRPIKFFL